RGGRSRGHRAELRALVAARHSAGSRPPGRDRDPNRAARHRSPTGGDTTAASGGDRSMREGTRMFLMTAVAALTVVSDVGHSAPGPGRDSFAFESYNGRSIAAERGFVRVPLRHAAPDGPAIEIAYVRLPATTAHPKAPIVFLDGGPGASGIRTGA